MIYNGFVNCPHCGVSPLLEKILRSSTIILLRLHSQSQRFLRLMNSIDPKSLLINHSKTFNVQNFLKLDLPKPLNIKQSCTPLICKSKKSSMIQTLLQFPSNLMHWETIFTITFGWWFVLYFIKAALTMVEASS